MIIGITGTDGGGKGTVVEYLLGKGGFEHCSARTLWVDEIKRRGLPVDRSNMRIIANDLRRIHGDDYLIREYARRTNNFAAGKDYLIESIRALPEAETLKKLGGILVAVDADQHIRYERVQERRRD